MIHENEIVMLLIGMGVLFLLQSNRLRLNSIPASKILILGFYLLFAGWFLTVLESFFWKVLFNILEHICYAGSSLLVAFWCWKVFWSREEGK